MVTAPDGVPLTVLPLTFTKSVLSQACQVDPSGNIVAVTLADAVTTQVTKIDGQLNVLWTKTIANFRIQHNCPVAVDGAGNIFVVGKAAGKSASIAQFTPDGTPGWMTSLGNSDEIDLVATGADNTIYGIGTGGQLPNQPPGGGGFAVHYGADGMLIQSLQETLITGDVGGTLQVDTLGDITFLGNRTITKLGPALATIWNISGPLALAVTPDGSGVYDWANGPDTIEKRDATTGAVLWTRGFATQTATLNAIEGQTWKGQFSGSTPIMVASSDSLYLAGTYTNSYMNGSSPIPSTAPAFVARLDSTGQQIWFRQFRATISGTTVRDLQPSALALTQQGKLLVASGSTVFFLNAADGTGP